MTNAELIEKLAETINNLVAVRYVLDLYDMSAECNQQAWLDAIDELDRLKALAATKTGEK